MIQILWLIQHTFVNPANIHIFCIILKEYSSNEYIMNTKEILLKCILNYLPMISYDTALPEENVWFI